MSFYGVKITLISRYKLVLTSFYNSVCFVVSLVTITKLTSKLWSCKKDTVGSLSSNTNFSCLPEVG